MSYAGVMSPVDSMVKVCEVMVTYSQIVTLAPGSSVAVPLEVTSGVLSETVRVIGRLWFCVLLMVPSGFSMMVFWCLV